MNPGTLAIHDLIDRLVRDDFEGNAAKVDRFLATHQVPLVEGARVTFLWRGEAGGVDLIQWIWGLESSQPMSRIPGTNLWWISLQLRKHSRVEYKLLVDQGLGEGSERRPGGHRELVRDPFNPQLAHDPFGSNSVCTTEGYEVPGWTQHDDEARPGVVEDLMLRSAAFGETRHLKVYLPARFRKTKRYPLLVAHDGSDYLQFSVLKTVLDNLIHRLEIPPMIVALSDPGDRLREYADDSRHARHVVDEILPTMTARFPLIDRPDARGLMGASFGAVASLSAAWRHPGVFGRLFLQSGSFAFTDIGKGHRGAAFLPVVEFVNAFRDAPGKPAEKVFLTCGVYESLIYENRSIVPVLQGTGMAVRFEEARDGHNWENWRDRMREGLSWLFPGPLWMVYE